MTAVRRLEPDAWQVFRNLRLAALDDAPLAFASTHARELAFSEAEWRARLGRATHLVATDGGGHPVGLVALLPQAPGEEHLVGMWVRPEHRGDGTATRLLEAALASVRPDTAVITLWVADGNPRARRFYERAGFRTTGERQPLPSAPERAEEKLVLPVRRP